MERYILIEREPVAEPDLMTWGRWMQTADRRVGITRVNGHRVSTVFLGLDHSFSDDDPALLFETMVFKGESSADLECERYSTWAEAEAGHAAMVAKYTVTPPLTPKNKEAEA